MRKKNLKVDQSESAIQASIINFLRSVGYGDGRKGLVISIPNESVGAAWGSFNSGNGERQDGFA